jgi:hypothetical protein
MKNQIIFLCLLVTAFGMGCKKENQQEVKMNKLQGKWEAAKRIYIYYEDNKEIERDESAVPPNEQVMVFEGDSLLIYNDGKRTNDHFTFILNGENLDIREQNSTKHMKLKWYHDKQIGVLQEDTDVNSGGAELRYVDEIVLVKK